MTFLERQGGQRTRNFLHLYLKAKTLVSNGTKSRLIRYRVQQSPRSLLGPNPRLVYELQIQRHSACSWRSVIILDRKMKRCACLWIGTDLEPSIAKMALTSKGVYGGGVVHPHLPLFSIIPHAHANMIITAETVNLLDNMNRGQEGTLATRY